MKGRPWLRAVKFSEARMISSARWLVRKRMSSHAPVFSRAVEGMA
jgi:hypothetical protein